MWTKLEIKKHNEAAKKLIKIKDLTFDYIKNNNSVSEYKVQQFIVKKFKEFNLKRDHYFPIVAFNKNTSQVHYFPKKKSKKLIKNSIILLDIWAKLNDSKSPFADITWMAFKGKKIPQEIQKTFNIVTKARDNCLIHIKKELSKGKIPTGHEIDSIARNTIKKTGFGKNFLHKTGHSLGYTTAHGNKGRIGPNNHKELLTNLGYTIEPGIYLKNKFGIRSEIDFYITKNLKLIATTDIQKKITKL